jgi:hypothetical protein
MSQSAMSMAESAKVNIPAGPEPPAAARSLATIASMRSGSSPIAKAPRSSTARFREAVIAPP